MVKNKEANASNTKEGQASKTESKSLTGFNIFLLVVIGILALICLSYIINEFIKAGDNWILFTFTMNSFVFLFKGLFSLADSSTSEGGSRRSKRKSKRKLYKNKKNK